MDNLLLNPADQPAPEKEYTFTMRTETGEHLSRTVKESYLTDNEKEELLRHALRQYLTLPADMQPVFEAFILKKIQAEAQEVRDAMKNQNRIITDF